jgi:hypothetical protein
MARWRDDLRAPTTRATTACGSMARFYNELTISCCTSAGVLFATLTAPAYGTVILPDGSTFWFGQGHEVPGAHAGLYEPSNNIWVHPNDTIYLYKEPQTFLAFGAIHGQCDFRRTAGDHQL